MTDLITYYGLPALFITINPSDISNAVVSFCHNTSTEPFNLDTLLPAFPASQQRAQMVAYDPLHASEFFHTLVNSFFETFLGHEQQNIPGEVPGKLLNPNIITGDNPGTGLMINAYFGTVECQNRGSLHLHLLVWMEGIPQPKEIIRRVKEACRTFPDHERVQAPAHPDQVRAQPPASVRASSANPDHQSVHLVDGELQNNISSPVLSQEYLDYFHCNAIGDGRCSIHATGDIICKDIDTTIALYDKYIERTVTNCDRQLTYDYAHPDIQNYRMNIGAHGPNLAPSTMFLQFQAMVMDRKNSMSLCIK